MSKTPFGRANKIVKRWRVRFEFKLQDFWIGVYWSRGRLEAFDLWVCIIPCLPLHISSAWEASDKARKEQP